MTSSAWPATKALAIALVLASMSFASFAGEEDTASGSQEEADDVAEVGQKLSNPVSNVWALFTEFDLMFSDGDANKGDARLGSAMLFQPILPIPLWKDWDLITRPTVPVVWSASIPQSFNGFERKIGLGDTFLPFLVAPPLGKWIVGLGPTFTLPTSTQDDLGRQQWAAGPAGIIGYENEDFILGVAPQYFFGIGSRGDQGSKPDASHMWLIYFAWLNLPNVWQIGFNPIITYDNTASSGNQWNVPVGLSVTKTVRIGPLPVKFQLGAEYSVVSQATFGRRALIKLNIIPVIPSLITKPLFGRR